MRFGASELAAITGGTVAGDASVVVDGATQDSRTVVAGNLFVPVVAARDGHDFVDAALASGAAAYLSSRGHLGATAVLVDDTNEALVALGLAARRRVRGPVVGITGSVGKTTTKDLLAAVLRRRHVTGWSDRSFNNELGVPLTLCNAPDDSEAVVVEMGARGVGHIATLCSMAEPNVGIVTVVAPAHLELFGSIDDVARGKGELVEALPSSGLAVLNADDHRVVAMRSRTEARVVTFGRETGDVRAEAIALDDELRPSFVLHSDWGSAAVRLEQRGAHNVVNALAAATAALGSGVGLDDVVAGLAAPATSPWRMDVRRAGSGAIVINDAYNANPESMLAALRALAHVPARHRFAIVGVMAELGDDARAEHARVAAQAHADGIQLVAVGAPEYGPEARHVARAADAAALLGPLGPDHAVLVKGSRVAGLEQLAADLLA